MATNNFKAFGIGTGANVTSQTDYEALAALLTGFQSGKASSAQINKALRQSSTMAYVLAQFISDSASVDVLDNGAPATILANLKASVTALTPGRLLNVQTFTTTGSYRPTPGTKKIRVFALGAGGAGGGCMATGSSQCASGNGGNGGSYGWTASINVSSISSIACVIGSGGVAVSGADGGAGGDTSFGSYIIASGGRGGAVGNPASSPSAASANAPSGECVGSAVEISVRGSRGSGKIILGTGNGQGLSGSGGGSPYGAGGGSVNNGLGAQPGYGYGAGGGSGVNISNISSTQAGANGSNGLIIAWEYL